MNVAVVAGEASGDRQAANLLRELASQLPSGEELDVWGIGGPHLADIGCDIVADSSTWGTIGVVNSLSQPVTLLSAMRKFKSRFTKHRPDLLLLVDFGAFNIPLARWAKNVTAGRTVCPVLYFFPPSSWRRNIAPHKLQKLAAVTDLIITPFSWSQELLRSVGANAHFLGHPLLDLVRTTMNGADFDLLYGIDRCGTVITLLPGSREHEVRYILPVMLEAAGAISRRLPGVQFLVARSPNLPRDLIEEMVAHSQELGSSLSLAVAHHASDLLKQATTVLRPQASERVNTLATPEGISLKQPQSEISEKEWARKRMISSSQSASLAIVENATYDAIARADLVIATSGTATLEAAILGRPQIIVYRGSSLMNIEYKLRRKALKLTFIGLPNILANEKICPEFIQDDASSAAISENALEMLLQPEKLLSAKAKMSDAIASNLGEPGATKRAATLVITFLKEYYGAGTNRRQGAGE